VRVISQKVSKWFCIAQSTCPNYDPNVVLALIAVESGGDPKAHRLLSQFHGLLQMGRGAGIDAGFADKGRHTTAVLNGNGALAIEKWHEYVERYRARHRDEPARIALLWKGGPGYLKTVNENHDAGAIWGDALNAADKKYGFSAKEYLRRFDAFFEELSQC